MAPSTPSLALSLLLPILLLRPALASPAVHRAIPDLPLPTYACSKDSADCNRPFDASVYLCENINFQDPCQLLRLEVNDAEYPFSGGLYWPSDQLGSIGPAPGISVSLYTEENANQTNYSYPGTKDVGDFWRTNLSYMQATWNPRVHPSAWTTVTANGARATPAAGPAVETEVVQVGEQVRPWWIQEAES